LFFGSDVGGATAAVLYSFTQTCRHQGIEPWRYLCGVLERLPTHPPEWLEELLPDRWAAAQRAAADPAPPSHPGHSRPPHVRTQNLRPRPFPVKLDPNRPRPFPESQRSWCAGRLPKESWPSSKVRRIGRENALWLGRRSNETPGKNSIQENIVNR